MINDDEQIEDQSSSGIQTSTSSIQTPGDQQPPPPGNPTFAVLKATALQQALGHPLAYARVLMQVKDPFISMIDNP